MEVFVIKCNKAGLAGAIFVSKVDMEIKPWLYGSIKTCKKLNDYTIDPPSIRFIKINIAYIR